MSATFHNAMPHNILLYAAVAYLLGSIPFGLLLTAAFGGGDIRKIGSGNIGATNVLRTGKKGVAAATLLLDALKGVLAVVLAARFAQDHVAQAMAVSAFCAVLGHCFPIWLGFKGGKGVASGLGVIWALCWPVGLISSILWLAVARFSRISSAGALTAFLAAPLLMVAMVGSPPFASPFPLATLGISTIIWLRHYGNIIRLINGTEPRVGQKSS
ncbi:glycerol-3-phosphate 1-O-acyltransferase PlsY [Neokomagataea anthophila]|nr:glycerol-3-phosphate 1-O-acyltransferase PlsY [Neokomagataea anthophila]